MAKSGMKVDANKIVRIVMLLLSASFLIALADILWKQTQTQHLTLAAGDSSGESYILGRALKTVVERHYPRIRITLVETGGTAKNLEMLEDGRAQLATAQSDILPGPTARIVAVLYDDTFQLMVPQSSQMRHFVDLRGMRIALARTGGQFQSFLRVAEHFGLHEADFHFVGSNDETADEAFLTGQADAIFRVRAIGNPSIQRLIQSNKVRFLPIEHAVAMKIKHPAFLLAFIPEGAYLGDPPVPAQDLPTIAVHRTLLARDGVNASAIQAITRVLMERQQELIEEIPPQLTEARLLLAQVRRPEPQTGFGPALHPGALDFYDKDKPTFLQTNADFVGLIITTGFMVASWIWQLNRWMQKQQKNAADVYSNRVVTLIDAAQEVDSIESLDAIWRDLLTILGEAVRDLDDEKISEESFHSFRSILQIGMDVARERRAILSSSSAGVMAVPVS
ncbi:MAG: TAXI family TRAP transporter solute-binding subunit [Terracidiphilus sp.]